MKTRARRGTIYGVHFSSPVGDPSKPHGTAQHYVGWADTYRLDRRFEEHCNGYGARITRGARLQGKVLTFFTIAKGTREDERALKNKKQSFARLCPICKAEKARVAAAGQLALPGLDVSAEIPF